MKFFLFDIFLVWFIRVDIRGKEFFLRDRAGVVFGRFCFGLEIRDVEERGAEVLVLVVVRVV